MKIFIRSLLLLLLFGSMLGVGAIVALFYIPDELGVDVIYFFLDGCAADGLAGDCRLVD